MTETLLSFLNRNEVSKLAQKEGFSYVDGEGNAAILSFLKTAQQQLRARTDRNASTQRNLIDCIREIKRTSATSEEATIRSYDKEYEGRKYGYASAILFPEGFELITEVPKDSAHDLRIIDVGAGSNEFLRFCRDTLGVPAEQLEGTDISKASTDIIAADGFQSHLGRLETLDLPEKKFDIVYLSYFIDYDTDQSATFDAAIASTKSGGRIVLEGLFPVKQFGLLESDSKNYSYITKGRSAKEDIELVKEAFSHLGEAQGRTVRLEKVVKTHRYVHSHFGFCELSSYFLTFRVTE